MKLILRFSLLLICTIPLVSRADLLTQTLSGQGGEAAIFSIAGHWVDEENQLDLRLTETREKDEFLFTYSENQNIWKGLLETSYYDTRVVLQVDLSKLTLNGEPVVQMSLPVYLLFGATKNKKELSVSPLHQEKFRKLLGKHFYAATVEGKCLLLLEKCQAEIKKHFMLSPKNTKDMNKDFSRRFRSVFDVKAATIFKLKEE
jgi:hypothetical protein